MVPASDRPSEASTPPKVLEGGDEAVKDWSRTANQAMSPLNEARLLLVGNGGAGKTSLVKRLATNSFNPNEPLTQGLNISILKREYPDRHLQLRVWDFGGQEIMHATHQLFLSRRSIYVIVLDSRKDSDPHYWLEHAALFGGSSPIILVINKIDEAPSYGLNIRDLRRHYPNIVDFVRVSCKTGHGIDTLREYIWNTASYLDHLRIPIPYSWLRVRTEVDSLNKPYLDQDEFSSICVNAGIDDQQEQFVLLQLLNDLGVVIYFPEIAFQVLDPDWVTSAIYRIINSDALIQSRGVLEVSSIKSILSETNDRFEYNANERRSILEVMKRFELCFDETPNTRILIPDHLPNEEPDFEFEFRDAIHLRYDFVFLPRSIFPRLLVRLSKVVDYDYRWRTGALAHSTEIDAQVLARLARLDSMRNSIEIWVIGKDTWRFVDTICRQMEGIAEHLDGIQITTMVPCRCSACARSRNPNLYYLRNLLKHVRNGNRAVICGSSDQHVSLSDLLPRHPDLNALRAPQLVFVSYSSKDMSIVSKVISDMRALGICYWIDTEKIKPGDSISDSLNKGLRSCSILLACLSKNQLNSGWARSEYGSALAACHSDGDKRVVPLILDDLADNDIPSILRDLHAIRLSDQEFYHRFLDELASGQLFRDDN